MMTMNEIKKKNDTDLKKLVSDKKEEIRKIRFESAGSGMRNTQAIKNLRTEVARALTELNSRAKIGE